MSKKKVGKITSFAQEPRSFVVISILLAAIFVILLDIYFGRLPALNSIYKAEIASLGKIKQKANIYEEISPIFVSRISEENINDFENNEILKDNNLDLEIGDIVLYFDGRTIIWDDINSVVRFDGVFSINGLTGELKLD